MFANATAAADSPPLMSLPGKFSVSPAGAATYSIPISLPPGTAGMLPTLTLDYSSQNGDGYIGMGWALDGISAITRCPRTVAQDGVHGGVNFDTNDRFCMENQRLVLVSGTYGANGSTYSTEIANFSEIIAHGSAGNGPAWFEVHTKGGQVIQFGNSSSSQILAKGTSTVRVWATNQVTDVKGNYYTVTYTNDTTNGQYYPTAVNYTGNANASVAPYNSVQLVYTTRPDIVPAYQAGSLIQNTVLLTDVKTYAGSTLVFDYKLAYSLADSGASHNELTSVTLCSGSGTCLPATTFGWQGSRDTLTVASVQPNVSVPVGDCPMPGDFNGDGLTDFFLNTSSGSTTSGTAYLGTATTGTFQTGGSISLSGQSINYECLSEIAVADINGDGISDIFALTFSTGLTSFLGNSQGQFTQINSIGTPAGSSPSSITFGDVNADGRVDLGYLKQNSPAGVYLGNGDGTFTLTTIPGTIGNSGTPNGDFTGDGCKDVLGTVNGTNFELDVCAPGKTIPSFTNPPYQVLVTGDFNGDGITDYLGPNSVCSNNAALTLSTGTGPGSNLCQANTASWIAGSGSTLNYTWVVGDFNGDGKDDLALISQVSGTPSLIYLSTGTGFVLAASIPNTVNATPTAPNRGIVGDWDNSGAAGIWIHTAAGDTLYTFSYVPTLMTSANNGIGATTTIAYNRLNANGTFYTKGTGSTYPTQDTDGALYAVSSIASANGIGGTYSTTYAYAGAKRDLSGRGFLGFAQVTATDPQTNIVTTTNYDTAFPLTAKIASQTKVHQGTTIYSLTNTWDDVALGGGSYFVGLHQSVEVWHDLNGAALPTKTTTTTYDCDSNQTCYGNATQTVLSISDGSSKTTTDTFSNNTADWLIGQITASSVQSVVGSSNITRTLAYTYDPNSGLVTQETVEPGNCEYQLQTNYTYDAFAHRTATQISGAGCASDGYRTGIATRTSTTNYSTYQSLQPNNGEFEVQACNALNQCKTSNFTSAASQSFGVPTSRADLNGLVTSWTYDALGRTTLETRPDGTETGVTYAYCSGVNGGTAACPTYGAYLKQSEPLAPNGSTQIGPTLTVYYDALGRIVAKDTQGFDGSDIRSATQFDANERVHQTSRPYFAASGTPQWTTFAYDDLGRVTQANLPNGRIDTYLHNGLTSSVTVDSGGKNEKTSMTLNDQGLKASVTDPDNETVSYGYDAFGNLSTVTDPSNNVTTLDYDPIGNKTDSYDPDLGHWTYVHDVLGELVSQTDANSNLTTLTYDVVGRLTSRNEPTFNSTWTYDGANGVGLPYTASTSTGYSRTFGYDSLSRPSQTSLTIGGNPYVYQMSYDTYGRKAAVTYPSGFVAKYVYTPLSYVSQIVDSASGTAYWTANARDAELHLTQATAGNGVVTNQVFYPATGLLEQTTAGPSNSVANFSYGFDDIGNLTSRSDTIEGVVENFCYDSLNRLTNYAVGGSSCTTGTTGLVKTMTYDALGNVSNKSDVGTYSYGAGAGPHAVTSISGSANGMNNPTFAYDTDGNMTSGDGRSLRYTSFNMAQQVTEGSTTLSFTYDSEHSRIILTGPSGTTNYINDPSSGAVEEAFVSGSTTTWRDYIQADGQTVAERFNTAGAITMGYFSLDNLGSIVVVAGASGSIVERDSYDAWGRWRNSNWSDNATCSISSETTRGYTNQEMIDPICSVNLNARIYDPTIGRFLSADSVIPDAYSGQSYNRYSYVENGPVSATDPTGRDPSQGPVETVTVTAPPYDPDNPGAEFGVGGLATGGAAGFGAVYSVSGTVAFTPSGAPGARASASGLVAPSDSETQNSINAEGQEDNSDANRNSKPLPTLPPDCNTECRVALIFGDVYFFETAAAETPPAKADDKAEDPVPTSASLVDPDGEFHGPYSKFHYQINDQHGNPLEDDCCMVREHVEPDNQDARDHWDSTQTSNNEFKGPVPKGVIPDAVGFGHVDEKTGEITPLAPPPKADRLYSQTFEVKYKGQIYTLTTKLEHENLSVDGVAENRVWVVKP